MISQICSATSRAGIKHTINSNQMLSCTSIIIGIDLGCYVSVIVGHGDYSECCWVSGTRPRACS